MHRKISKYSISVLALISSCISVQSFAAAQSRVIVIDEDKFISQSQGTALGTDQGSGLDAVQIIQANTPSTTSPAATGGTGLPSIPSASLNNGGPLASGGTPAPIFGGDHIANLVEHVSPSVVNVIVRTEDGQTTSEGQGSGFIIGSDGTTVTNYHVIEGGSSISVEFNDGRKYPATIIGTDEETDLAVLKIESDKTFPKVDFHNGEDMRIGDWVVAIGNPFGIGQSTSFGVISAIGRSRVESGSYVDYIQTDATINRGNSGGPLFNPVGDVIGVNSAIYSPTGASVGIAFAIPHYTAADIVGTIIRDGEVRRGWLGVGFRTAEYDDGVSVYKSGASINNIVPGGPAEQAGLRVDDIILNINDQTVRNATEATRVIGRLSPGDQATFIFERNEEYLTQSVIIDERPEKKVVENTVRGTVTAPPPPAATSGSGEGTGLSLVDLSASFRDAIGMRPDQVGVYVESVAPGSAAARKGFQADMVILESDGRPVASVRLFNQIISQTRQSGKSDVLIGVRLSNGGESYVSLPL